MGEFVSISKNIFTYNGKDAHELILFYNVDINDTNYKEKYHIVDDNSETDEIWIDIDEFVKGENNFFSC